MTTIGTPTSILAEAINEQSHEGGTADAALDPGSGCVRYYDNADDEWRVRAAEANEETRRVVREQRNPPRSLSPLGESPLLDGYDADDYAETIGFNPHEKVRVRKSANASGDVADDAQIAWDENGHATDENGTTNGADAPTAFWGRYVETVTVTDEDDNETEFLVVEVN
jgi:hypothetical protein